MDEAGDDTALKLLRAALVQLELEGRRVPGTLVQKAIDMIEEEAPKPTGAQAPHWALQ